MPQNNSCYVATDALGQWMHEDRGCLEAERRLGQMPKETEKVAEAAIPHFHAGTGTVTMPVLSRYRQGSGIETHVTVQV